MGEILIRAADAFGLESSHVAGPDVGTSAALFAAVLHPERLRSLVVGTGASVEMTQHSGDGNHLEGCCWNSRLERAEITEAAAAAS